MTNVTDRAAATLALLTADPGNVPAEWLQVLAGKDVQPDTYRTWADIPQDQSPDIVIVFPDQYQVSEPLAAEISPILTGIRWVAALDQPGTDDVSGAIVRGYNEVLDLAGSPAMVLGPVLRLRELRGASETTQRLLEESLAAYQELSLLDKVRDNLRILDFKDLAPRIVQEFAAALGEPGGILWTPNTEAGKSGQLTVATVVGQDIYPDVDELPVHALPHSTEILDGKVVQVLRDNVETVWIPFVDSSLLLAVVQIPRPSGKPQLTPREQGRLRQLLDWLLIALGNSLETEQMRSVLRSRFGDYFSPESFRQHVDKALLQASRYRRPVSLIGLEFFGSESIRERIFQLVLELLRDADVFEEPEGQRAKIFLPETGYLGGVQFLRRLQRELSQKYQPHVVNQLSGVVAAYPHHATTTETLYTRVVKELDQATEIRELLGSINVGRVRELPGLLSTAGGTPFNDPNMWADLAYHLIQETSMVDSESTRMVLFLGAYKDSVRTFSSLFEYPARWDRILVAAGMDDETSMPESKMIRLVRDEQMLHTYLAMLERPCGSVAVWATMRDTQWQGGINTDPLLVRASINRFEDQYLLHQKWVTS